jgi:hypothetical protein
MALYCEPPTNRLDALSPIDDATAVLGLLTELCTGYAALVWAGFVGGLVGFWLNPVAWWIAYAWCSIGWIVCLVWAFTRQRATS